MSRAAASRVAAAAGPSSPTPRGGRRGRGCAGCVSGGGGGGGGEGGGGGGGGEGGRGEKDAAAAGSAGHAPPSPPPLRTYSRAGLAALDEVLRRDAMPLLTFAQPSAAKCKRDMDALFDALDTDGVAGCGLLQGAAAGAREQSRLRRRSQCPAIQTPGGAPCAALLSPTGKVAVPSEPAS